jgi:hypothetical protein
MRFNQRPFFKRFAALLAYCLIFVIGIQAQQQTAPNSTLNVVVKDAQNAPVKDAACLLLRADDETQIVSAAQTDEQGRAQFVGVAVGAYTLRVTKEGFENFTKQAVAIKEISTPEISVTLAVAALAADVTVRAGGELSTSIEAGATTPNAVVKREELRALPLPAQKVEDALPLIPGVVRSSKGELSIKGANEEQNALIINGVHANDPATGNFRLNLPLDSVEAVQVYQHPYTAEYGRFIGGVTNVVTKRGGETFHWELNDFFPDFRFKGGKLVGVAENTPRLNLNGPLIKDKLFFSQSLAYNLAKTPVRGLTFPDNEKKTESQSYFSQLDWILSDKHTETFTLGYFPERDQFLNLDFFHPRPVTPNFRQKDYVVTARDNYALRNGLLESVVSFKRFNANVWGQGNDEQTLTPTGSFGNYFAQQDRHASRFETLETYQFPTFHFLKDTQHEIKAGFNFISVSSRAFFNANPVNIVRADGTLAERIIFDDRRARPILVKNHEYSGFIQDRWRLRENLSVDLGLRYEDQRIAAQTNLVPRAGFAWSPFKGDRTVVRGGIGMFHDKVPLNIRGFSNYPPRLVINYAGDGQTIVDRTYYKNILVDARPIEPLDFRRRNPNAGFVPDNLTWNFEVTHQLTPKILLRANYINSTTNSIYIINPEVDYRGRSAIVLRSAGEATYKAFELITRFSLPHNDALYVSYVRSRARGDLNDFNSYFGDASAPVIRQNQYSNLSFDVPNRILAWGTFSLPRQITLAPIIEWRTGFPYSVLDGAQNFVGVRNSDQTRFPDFFSFDLEVAKTFQVTPKYGVRLALRGYNLTNHFNPQSVHANIADPLFGTFFAQTSRTFTGGFDILF